MNRNEQERRASADYTVGYKRPPKHTQFEKGRSGNPQGRPRSASPTAVDVIGVLTEEITVKEKAGARPMQPFEIMIRKLLQRALKEKHLPSILRLIELFEKHGLMQIQPARQSSGVLGAPPGVDFRTWSGSIPEMSEEELDAHLARQANDFRDGGPDYDQR